MRFESVKLGDYLYIKGRIGWKGLKKSEYLLNGEYRIINGEALTEDGIDWTKAGFITKERYDESPEIMLQNYDILISKDGTIGKIGFVENLDKPTSVASGIFVIRNLQPDIIDTKFIYYFFCSPFFKDFIAMRTEGSVIPHLYQKDFVELNFPLPSIDLQQKIVAILDAISYKINLNKHINQNLEQQIELFLSNMMLSQDKAPKVKLGEYLYIKGRIGWKGLKKSEYLPLSGYRIINGESLTSSGIDWDKAGYISSTRYLESPEIMLKEGDILLSKDGTIGKIGYVDKLELPTSVASGIFVIRNVKPNLLSTVFIYYLLKSPLFMAFVSGRTEGSVIPHLYQKDFMDFEFPLPNKTTMEEFDSNTAPMFSLVIKNLNENTKLATLRDILLPRLMSGELDVSELDI